jgi:hypothetical protein
MVKDFSLEKDERATDKQSDLERKFGSEILFVD